MHLKQLLFFLSVVYHVAAIRITGATSNINANGARPDRLNIRTLQTSGPKWDLYIQALQKLQSTAQSNIQSHYEIAGIHGRPYRSWDGVSGNYQRGYCTHGSTIFPTWHRPYLALYEQVLWNHAQQIAATYPTSNRATYQAAANDFRIPYWDWASSSQIPTALTASSVTINTPTGSRSVTNPLFRYVFNPRVTSPDFPNGDGFSGSANTARNSQAQSRLTANAASLNDRTYLLLSRQSSYSPFASNAYVDTRGNRYDSVESIHDSIHGIVGGWMGVVAYSAFDPIFFLHHTNVDRIFALWQALYPSSFVSSQVNNAGTFTNAPGTSENANTPLTPFHSDAGTGLYTSNTARSTRTFGYTYPEIRDWGVDATTLASRVRAAVKSLYDPNNEFTPRSLTPFPFGKRTSDAEQFIPPFPNTNIGKRQSNAVPAGLKDSNGAFREWYANIRINKFVIKESFFIHIFVGPVPADKSQWLTSTSFVGTFVVFTDNAMVPSSGNPNTYGQIPLTRTLIERFQAKVAGVPDLSVPAMRKYLKANLAWRAQKYDDTEIPLTQLRSLRVFAASGLVRPKDNSGNKLVTPAPEVAPLEAVPEITVGKTGGVPDGDSAGELGTSV